MNQTDEIMNDDNLEYEDVRSSNDMIRSNPDVKIIKQKKEVDYVGILIKYVLILLTCYIVYLLGSSFINYGKDGDLLIEVVKEYREEDNTLVDRYRLFTNGTVEKVNTNGKDEVGLGQVMLLNLYSKTLYRFAIDTTAKSTDDFYHIYVFNSSGDIIKEYEGKEMFFNIPITKLVYAEETKQTSIIGE